MLHTYKPYKDVHVQDCSDWQLRSWIKDTLKERHCSIHALTQSNWWPKDWHIGVLHTVLCKWYVVYCNGKVVKYADNSDPIFADTIHRLVMRAFIVARVHNVAKVKTNVG